MGISTATQHLDPRTLPVDGMRQPVELWPHLTVATYPGRPVLLIKPATKQRVPAIDQRQTLP